MKGAVGTGIRLGVGVGIGIGLGVLYRTKCSWPFLCRWFFYEARAGQSGLACKEGDGQGHTTMKKFKSF